MYGRLGEPQGPSEGFYEEEDIFPGTGCETLISHHVAQPL